MSRIADYMKALADLLGETDSVHFLRLESGSTTFVQAVEPGALQVVRNRLVAVAQREAADDADKAVQKLNRLLAEDSTTGSLVDGNDTKLVSFPGHDGLEHPQVSAYNAVRESSSVDGVLTRIGGRGNSVSAHLQDGGLTHICTANRDMARRLAPHLFGDLLRVQGEGQWQREDSGTWALRRLNIASFQVLKSEPLTEVVKRLRSIEGSDWKNIDDPVAELKRIREL